MFAEAGLSSLSRPPCVAQYVPSITGLQGSGAAPVGDCANNPVLETAMTVAATIANAKYRFQVCTPYLNLHYIQIRPDTEAKARSGRRRSRAPGYVGIRVALDSHGNYGRN